MEKYYNLKMKAFQSNSMNRKRKFIFSITFMALISFNVANAQKVGINTQTVPSDAVLNIESNVGGSYKGMLLPRMTSTQRDAISTTSTGLVIYNTTTNRIEMWIGAATGWIPADGRWRDASNGSSRTRIDENVGIYTDPDVPLHVYSSGIANLLKLEQGSTINSSIEFRNTSGVIYAGLVGNDRFVVSDVLDPSVAETMLMVDASQESDIFVNGIRGGIVPAGGIIMWSGSTVPDGWAICNGSNGTPNLSDRFIVGSGGSYAIGDTGGEAQVTLTTSQMPSHSHGSGNLVADSGGAHKHEMGVREVVVNCLGCAKTDAVDGSQDDDNIVTENGGEHEHTISGSTGNAGSGQSHENRPPYYALAFIMKL